MLQGAGQTMMPFVCSVAGMWGIHHIAFVVKSMDEKILAMENFCGAKCVRRSKYGGGNGEYAYLDAHKDVKCLLELLEND